VSPLVALSLNGAPLSRDHGYPARLVLPDRLGFKNTKWLARIEATASDEPFGDYQALGLASDAAVIPLNTTYRGSTACARARLRVTLCGQTHSGSGAIERVEIAIGRRTARGRAHRAPFAAARARAGLRETEQVQQGYPYPFVGVATPWEHDFVASLASTTSGSCTRPERRQQRGPRRARLRRRARRGVSGRGRPAQLILKPLERMLVSYADRQPA